MLDIRRVIRCTITICLRLSVSD